MFDKLDFILEKYEELAMKVSDPDVINDQPSWQKYIKEMGEMEPIVNKYKEYKKTKESVAEAKEMLDSGDEELKELAKMELADLEDKIPEMENDLKVLLLPKDPNDDKNVILEIRAGTGGEGFRYPRRDKGDRIWESDPVLCVAALYSGEGSQDECRERQCQRCAGRRDRHIHQRLSKGNSGQLKGGKYGKHSGNGLWNGWFRRGGSDRYQRKTDQPEDRRGTEYQVCAGSQRFPGESGAGEDHP